MAETNGAGDVQQFPDDLLTALNAPPKGTFELVDESPDGQDESRADEPDVSLADAQEDEQSESEQADDALSGMRLYDFAKAAGWKLQEFYDHVMIPVDGVDVPIGKAINDMKSVRDQADALSRERNELQEKLAQTATNVPQQEHSPEAAAMLEQARQWEEFLLKNDWTQYDTAQAAMQKIDIKAAIDQQRQAAYQKEAEFQHGKQQQMSKAFEECDRQMRSLIPAWSDQSVKGRDEQRMYDTATKYGFSRQEVDSWMDSRARFMLHKLAEHESKAAQIKQGAKRINKVGKTLGAGSRTGLPNDKQSLAEVAKDIRKAAGNNEELSRVRQTRDLGPLR